MHEKDISTRNGKTHPKIDILCLRLSLKDCFKLQSAHTKFIMSPLNEITKCFVGLKEFLMSAQKLVIDVNIYFCKRVAGLLKKTITKTNGMFVLQA